MKIFKISNYKLPAGIKNLNNSINSLSTKADKLMSKKTYVTDLLPKSGGKCRGTDMNVPQMIDLVLRNL